MFSPGPVFVLGFSTVSHLKEMKLLLNFFPLAYPPCILSTRLSIFMETLNLNLRLMLLVLRVILRLSMKKLSGTTIILLYLKLLSYSI